MSKPPIKVKNLRKPPVAVGVGVPTATGEAFYTVEEVALKLGVCTKSIRRRVKDGSLKSIRVGRLIRIPAAALADYLNYK